MKVVEAKEWLDAHPPMQSESQWAYVMRMMIGYGAAIEQAARREALEDVKKALINERNLYLSERKRDVITACIEHVDAIRAIMGGEG